MTDSTTTTPKTWFITGASTGIGRLIAERLLARGDQVAATARRPDALDELAERHGDRLHAGRLDLTDTASIRSALDAAAERFGRIDVVISNAGAGLVGAAEEVTDEQIREQVDTNLIGSIQLGRAAIARLRLQGGGRIVQVSSMVPIAIAGLSLYHATKWGIEGFWEAVIPEVASFGIGVTIVQPGSARTAFGGRAAVAPAMPEYADTPVAVRRAKSAAGGSTATAPGDPAKMAGAIIAIAEFTDAPRRIALGSDAYRLIGAALRRQLDELDAHRELTCSTDVDPAG